ncbi:alpha-glucuronidase [Chryseotalea sanaruensis]|uniref:Xylan alpha-1,2-glucuronidase n=1 Tax=Chryseotalea sanaruensis TaxID=2482724 RepID=A0A401U5V2_9BACT|nr:alpha-glucuronidase family glycosyl hydrolase [Chryseotalea sanaruensis]GCC50303.1 alpha-glucuronidase [Chryseotalea sanaruensis]
MRLSYLILLGCLIFITGKSENGYDLWLRYAKLTNDKKLAEYKKQITSFRIEGSSPTLSIASDELSRGLLGLFGSSITQNKNAGSKGNLIICGRIESPAIKQYLQNTSASTLGNEGYTIQTITKDKQKITLIAANEDIGVLYGVFHLLRLIQTEQPIHQLAVTEIPKIKLRVLNHWDNLDRTVERGYAGFSLWNWHKLPQYIDQRYLDYARANASIGINGTVLTNVNANANILTEDYLKKVEALANAFRPYGIKVYLTARFSAPIELGDLPTADPLDQRVQQWWNDKAKEIYQRIPDFGGFLVKANSEGQPGPQNYGRTHKDGANMLATAVEPYKGVVIWRAFVYDNNVPDDRAKQAYTEFKPLDGTFKENVLVQVKNGAIDFQPREPFHPLFGAMPKTPLMMEFQITQEYLGFSTHLVYLSTMFKECLEADTKTSDQMASVARIVDGTIDKHALTGIAGVANIGTDINWCGHPFAQANWYAFGRLAWNHTRSSEAIADEWIRMTFSNEEAVIKPVKEVMMASREITVNYMTPLGLHHLMGWSHHHGPAPWIKDKHRADWTSVYYHKADSLGIGFNRTATGSDAVSQYSKAVAAKFSSLKDCPEEFLLWFHHVPWDHQMKSGRTLWDELCHRYYEGVDSVKWMQENWQSLKGKVDKERFDEVTSLLALQYEEASIWRDACLLYFQTFSKKPIPSTLPSPKHSLEYYKNLTYPYAPGIKSEW